MGALDSMLDKKKWFSFKFQLPFHTRITYEPIYLTHNPRYTAHRRWTHTVKDLKESVNACWVSSAKSVSRMWLIISAMFFFILFAMYGIVCVEQGLSRLGDRNNIIVTHFLIIIKSELSIFTIDVIFTHGAVVVSYIPWESWYLFPLLLCSLRWVQIFPGTLWFAGHIYVSTHILPQCHGYTDLSDGIE